MAGVSREVAAAWVEQSCAAQGVPSKVTDPTVLRRVGVLLTGAPGAKPAPRRRPAPDARSQPPHRDNTSGIEPA